MKKILLFVALVVGCCTLPAAPTTHNSLPQIGAQVFIEPGQTPEEIESLFALMRDNGMTVCRIRLFESYLKKADGTWDFTLFDTAFRMADKYGIDVYCTLFPYTPFTDVGGFKFPSSRRHQQRVAEYIERSVTHFSNYKSLKAWVLINEPGILELNFDEELTREVFEGWMAENASPQYNAKGYPVANFDRERFLVYYHTWYLEWLAGEIRKYDRVRELHVNPHAIFEMAACYDFPAWRKFLSTLGGSAHASWHFGYFARNRYNVAMSANAEIVRSGAGELPWIMTELQGGNNLYSGIDPMCPTREEIAQWLWINIATGAKANIFWSLNARSSGPEAGEWAMVNFKNEPSDRVEAAAEVAAVLKGNPGLFSSARVMESGIDILYNKASMWVEASQAPGRGTGNARSAGTTMISPLAYFEALTELGLQANFREVGEFDFSREDYTGRTIILSHQISLDEQSVRSLEAFVQKGGTLIMDGLTGFYDQYAHASLVHEFNMKGLLGAQLLELKVNGELFPVTVNGHRLHAHMWLGTLETADAEAVGYNGREAIACVNEYGRGRVVWVPSLLGMGARKNGDYGEVAAWLAELLPAETLSQNFRFSGHVSGLQMKSMQSGEDYLSVIINKGTETRELTLFTPVDAAPFVLFANKGGGADGNRITINPEETIVIRWSCR